MAPRIVGARKDRTEMKPVENTCLRVCSKSEFIFEQTLSLGRTRQAHEGQAFTLTELLVVISILTMLASLLLPALAKAKAQTRRVICASNLRQLGMALSMYIGDFHQYPIADEWGQVGLPSSGGKLLPYLVNTYGVFICPEKERAVKSGGIDKQFSLFSYGYNGAGTVPGGFDLELGMGLSHLHRISDSRIEVPSDMIVSGDSGIGSLSDWLISPNQDAAIDQSAMPYNPRLPSRRHSSGAKILFCDVHVGYGKQERWIEKSSQARRQWNNDNHPHPETW